MSIQNPPPLPNADEPISDKKMNAVWYRYFVGLLDRFKKLLTMYGTGATTVAGLPAAAEVGAGARAFVTDANATTFHNTVAAGGSNKVPVVSDGTNWLIG